MATATVKPVTIDANTRERLDRVLAAYNADLKYKYKEGDLLHLLLSDFEREEEIKERRKTNARRKRLNYRKWWVTPKIADKLDALKKTLADENDSYGALNRIEANTGVISFLLQEHEEMERVREERGELPIGAQVGGREDTCSVCLSPVGEVFFHGERVEDPNGPYGRRVISLRYPPLLVKAAKTLRDWVPEFGTTNQTLNKKIKASYHANGAPEDEFPPFVSETFLYELLGKDDARTFRALVRELLEAAGMRREEINF